MKKMWAALACTEIIRTAYFSRFFSWVVFLGQEGLIFEVLRNFSIVVIVPVMGKIIATVATSALGHNPVSEFFLLISCDTVFTNYTVQGRKQANIGLRNTSQRLMRLIRFTPNTRPNRIKCVHCFIETNIILINFCLVLTSNKKIGRAHV